MTTRRKTSRPYLTKTGQYGTLYRWAIPYEYEPGQPAGDWHVWAYDQEHAVMNWHDQNLEEFTATGLPRKLRER